MGENEIPLSAHILPDLGSPKASFYFRDLNSFVIKVVINRLANIIIMLKVLNYIVAYNIDEYIACLSFHFRHENT